MFDGAITDLSELAVCEYVNGDLKLATDATGSAGATTLKKVMGNVYLANLNESSVPFLKRLTDQTVTKFACELWFFG